MARLSILHLPCTCFSFVWAANYKSLIPCSEQEQVSLHHVRHHLQILRAALAANLHNVENCLLKQSSKHHRLSKHEKKLSNKGRRWKTVWEGLSSVSNTALAAPLPQTAQRQQKLQGWITHGCLSYAEKGICKSTQITNTLVWLYYCYGLQSEISKSERTMITCFFNLICYISL